jgi:hypothetical protein
MHVQPKRLRGGIALGMRDRDAAQQIFLLEDFRAGTGCSQERAGERDRRQHAIQRQLAKQDHWPADLLRAEHDGNPATKTRPS